MNWFLTFIVGVISGFLVHMLTMKVSFKQRTIENRIRVYDLIIGRWVIARNFIYSRLPKDPHEGSEFDKLYGESQAFLGEAFLVSEDEKLSKDINELNEKFFRTVWVSLSKDEQDEKMELLKKEAIAIIKRMRADIKDCTRFEWGDFKHMFTGLHP